MQQFVEITFQKPKKRLSGMSFAPIIPFLRPELVNMNQNYCRDAVMDMERRKHYRLPLQMELLCRKVGNSEAKINAGRTLNVSTGGLFFETDRDDFERGELVNIEFSAPFADDNLELGTKFSGFAKVLRVSQRMRLISESSLAAGKARIAVEFCQPPKLCL